MMCGAVILCGGRSRRMGRDKASLPFGDETLLGRTVRIVSQAVPEQNIVCMAAAGQSLPTLPAVVSVLRDDRPDQGPLAAMATGLRQFASECELMLVVGCDAPLLSPALLELLFKKSSDAEIVVGEHEGRDQPFPGVYRSGVSAAAEALLAAGERSMKALIRDSRTLRLDSADVAQVDPDRLSYLNCNDELTLRRALNLRG